MNVSYDFHGKAAFVTGAASGIGRTTALAFARAGARVALVDRSADGLRETARLIETDGGQALTLTCDVTSEEDVQTAVDRTVEQFGSLDAAFDNAGVEQPIQSVANTAEDDWARILGVSLTGAFLCTRAQVRQMLRQDGGGAIVNVSSGAGVKGFKGQAAYAAAKHGIIGFTRSAALDHAADNIRINAVCPGIIATPMVDAMIGGGELDRDQAEAGQAIERLGTAEEIAQAVLWLCSDGASYVTGIALPVDGGYTAQ
ncbi:SDR family oxidoreductase [Streptomyces sp. NPDC007851]|uniref:SDR family NAD(P)-dependent oxidoreductase n=1 Tax=Streptomyces sp. NPDC007851 TaxID=3155008 RepID=UPI00340CCFE8